MTKAQALKMFKQEIATGIKKTDKTALRTAWHMFTDGLCKDGEITQKQYDNWGTPKEFQ